jgi:hypothetical protein
MSTRWQPPLGHTEKVSDLITRKSSPAFPKASKAIQQPNVIRMGDQMRVGLYLRVSTGEQTVANQERELVEATSRHGWEIVATY